MLRSELRLVIPGTPATKGSLKCVGQHGRHQLVEQLPTTGPWVDRVADAARKHLAARADVDPGQAVGVEVTVSIPRVKSHHGTGRNLGRLKASAPIHPTGHGTGDSDKYVRGILDALQAAGVLRDDAQVVEQSGRKAYVDPDALEGSDVLGHAGVVIRIYPIGAT